MYVSLFAFISSHSASIANRFSFVNACYKAYLELQNVLL